MRSFLITRLGAFMGKLLSSDCFDDFLLEEASVSMACTLRLDGHLNPAFCREAEDAEEEKTASGGFLPWRAARPLCHDFIRGRQAPSSFCFVLHAPPKAAQSLLAAQDVPAPETVRALLLSVRYDGERLTLTTGVSMDVFSLDKSAETVWDNAVPKWLSAKGVDYEAL